MKNLILLFTAIITLSSCKNMVPYTDALRQKYNWSENDLKRIQFYTSDAIVLQRKIVEGETRIQEGKIKTINGEKVEEIIIRSGTPGILIEESNGKLSVSFEKNDQHYINFGKNVNMNNRFSIAFSSLKNKIGTINYNGTKYFTAPETVDAILMVDMRRIDNSELNQRVAKGRKVK
jgi:hypothetical protein